MKIFILVGYQLYVEIKTANEIHILRLFVLWEISSHELKNQHTTKTICLQSMKIDIQELKYFHSIEIFDKQMMIITIITSNCTKQNESEYHPYKKQ